MSSVGSLTISVKAETAQMRADLDKGLRKIETFASGSKRAADTAGAGFAKMGLSTEKLGKGIGTVVAGSLLMTGALEKAGPVADGLGKTFGAFLAGGPIAAGVVGLTTLIGHLTKKSEEAAEAEKKRQEKAAQAAQTYRDGVTTELERIAELEKAADRAWDIARGRRGEKDQMDAEDALRDAREQERGVLAGRGKVDTSNPQKVAEFNGSLQRARTAVELATRALEAVNTRIFGEKAQEQYEEIRKERQAEIDARGPEFAPRQAGGMVEIAPGRWETIGIEQLKVLQEINRNINRPGRLGK
jgi:hypothetical protein